MVTANKALLARHGASLAALAERHQATLNFEASVGAAIPIVKTLREGLRGNAVERVYGILNGTCNYILTRMERERLAFDDCLKEAQRLGYAEADPTFDIEGFDTAQKLAILASLAFGTRIDPDAVYVEGISSITLADLDAADELGYRVKLLGVAVRTETGIEQRVHPTMVPKNLRHRPGDGRHQCDHRRCRRDRSDHPGRPRRGRHGDRLGGRFRHCRHCPRRAQRRPSAVRSPISTVSGKAPMQRHEGGYYIRLLARDRPGTAAHDRHAAGGKPDFAGIDRAEASRRPTAGRRTRCGGESRCR